MGEEKFLRPEKRREDKGGEKFHEIFKRTIRRAFQLLFLIFILFISYQLYIHLLEDAFFQVRELEVRGCRKIPEKIVFTLAGIEGMPNLFTVPLKEISKRVEAHPWVEQVNVRKVFPGKIMIQVEERKPIAILQLEEPYYIDSQGVIFSRVGDRDEYNFPCLTGLTRKTFDKDPNAAKHLIMKALEFLKATHEEKVPSLDGVSEIHMEKTFGIECFTQNEGVEVRMGWNHFEEKLKRLSLIWSDLQKRGVEPALIDCSDLKRMVVKLERR
jgi:cell division septal protein FtsQ